MKSQNSFCWIIPTVLIFITGCFLVFSNKTLLERLEVIAKTHVSDVESGEVFLEKCLSLAKKLNSGVFTDAELESAVSQWFVIGSDIQREVLLRVALDSDVLANYIVFKSLEVDINKIYTECGKENRALIITLCLQYSKNESALKLLQSIWNETLESTGIDRQAIKDAISRDRDFARRFFEVGNGGSVQQLTK